MGDQGPLLIIRDVSAAEPGSDRICDHDSALRATLPRSGETAAVRPARSQPSEVTRDDVWDAGRLTHVPAVERTPRGGERRAASRHRTARYFGSASDQLSDDARATQIPRADVDGR